MRITIVQGPFFPVPPLLGGAVEKVWYALGKEFARLGHNVTHISRNFNGFPTTEIIDSVNHIRVNSFNATSFLYYNLLLDVIYALRVYRNLPEADILISNCFSLPLFIRNKKFGLLYIHLARKPKGQLFLYRHAARIQTVSKSVEHDIINQEPYLEDRIKTIHYPFPMNLNYKNPVDIVNSKEKKMLYVGRLHPEKGLDILIGAFNELIRHTNDWTLEIVGPWEISQGGAGYKYYSDLKKISQPSGQKIRFAGFVYDEAVLSNYYKTAKLFIYPSIAEQGESFGLAPLEAMSFGCVPIVSSLDCFKDFIDDGESGYVFDHRADNSKNILSDILIRLIRSDLGEISVNTIRKSKQFSLEQISQIYLDDFSELIRNNN